jgi:hypothetical protein
MTSIRRSLIYMLFSPLRIIAFQITRFAAVKLSIGKVEILDTGAPTKQEALTERVAEALRILDHHSPAVSGRVQRYVRKIVIADHGPAYAPTGRLCILKRTDVERVATGRLAMQIAHEATHGRLHSCGFKYEGAMRTRIEHACVAVEVRLAQRLPGGHVWAAQVQGALEKPWWTDSALDEMSEQKWKQRGAAQWLLRLRRILR